MLKEANSSTLTINHQEIQEYAVSLRIQRTHYFDRPLESTRDVVMFLMNIELNLSVQEQFIVLFVSADLWVTGYMRVGMGSSTETIAHPSEVFRAAILSCAHRIIIAHNHPFGAAQPSTEDINLTQQLVHAGNILNIPIQDHIIISGTDFFSFKQKGLL
jgi:DNA repair protein RadC